MVYRLSEGNDVSFFIHHTKMGRALFLVLSFVKFSVGIGVEDMVRFDLCSDLFAVIFRSELCLGNVDVVWIAKILSPVGKDKT